MRVALLLFCLIPFSAFAQSNTLKTPNVSGDALFLYRSSNFNKEDKSTVRNGIDLQEAELAFYSDVDPYSRLSMLFSAHPDYKLNDTTNKVEETWAFEPEELFVESDHVPGVTFKVGKFKAGFGKHNTLHTHAFPFVDAPMINSTLLGEEGLNDVGVSAAILLPVSWFSELTLQYLRGEDGNTEFNSPTPGDGVGLAHFKNVVDLTDDLTMEPGVSFAQGNNAVGGVTSLTGGDLTFKWRPAAGGRYHSGILAFEYIDRALEQKNSATEHGHGLSSWISYQFAERWAARFRYETLQVSGSDKTVNPDHFLSNALSARQSAMLQFDATEFSFFRLEYDLGHGPAQPNGDTNEHKIYLQANFTIGSHPAHSY
jgi:hypothetical protein